MRQDNNYDERKGLEDTNPGWYTFKVHAEQFEWSKYVERYFDIVDWLYESIDKCEKHVIWGNSDSDCMIIRFRYEKHYLHFMLRWA